jgi:hypothetical protein
MTDNNTTASKPDKKITTSDVVIPTVKWGMLFLVCFFVGIAALANSALWGLAGIALGLYFGWKIVELWIMYTTLKRANQI